MIKLSCPYYLQVSNIALDPGLAVQIESVKYADLLAAGHQTGDHYSIKRCVAPLQHTVNKQALLDIASRQHDFAFTGFIPPDLHYIVSYT